jgi:predicted dehydrogenase
MLQLKDVELSAVVDIDEDRARKAGSRFGVDWFRSHHDLRGRVDAAVVAVPTSAHHDVAADLLVDGLNLLVEKPLAKTVEQAENLCRLASDRNLRLLVGHLERFNPVFVEALKQIHEPRKIEMERSGPFPGRGGDVGVVLELMTHDLDILLQMARFPVTSIVAKGKSVFTKHLDQATAQIDFENGFTARLQASRASTERIRRFKVEDADGHLEVDLAGRRMRRLANGGEANQEVPRVFEQGDPLLEQDRSFVDVLHNGMQPRVSGEAGKAAVILAARILEDIRNGGSH